MFYQQFGQTGPYIEDKDFVIRCLDNDISEKKKKIMKKSSTARIKTPLPSVESALSFQEYF